MTPFFQRIPLLFVLLCVSGTVNGQHARLEQGLAIYDRAISIRSPVATQTWWKVVVTATTSDKVFVGDIADVRANNPLAQSNRRGACVFYHVGHKTRSGQHDDKGHKTGVETKFWSNGHIRTLRRFDTRGKVYSIEEFRKDGTLKMDTPPDANGHADRTIDYTRKGWLVQVAYTVQRDCATGLRLWLCFDVIH